MCTPNSVSLTSLARSPIKHLLGGICVTLAGNGSWHSFTFKLSQKKSNFEAMLGKVPLSVMIQLQVKNSLHSATFYSKLAGDIASQ